MSKVGGSLFTLGALSAIFTVGYWLFTGGAPGLWAYCAGMLMPVGFALVGWDFLRRIRRQGSTRASE